MLSLPTEVQNHIFDYLDQKSLESVSRVCKKYESMCTLIWLRALNKPPFRDPPKDTSPLGVRRAIIRYYKDYNETFRFLWEISREKKNCFHEKSEYEEKIYLLKKKSLLKSERLRNGDLIFGFILVDCFA